MQVTNGFPVNPSPLFSSSSPFVPENRTGLQDQTMGKVAASFATAAASVPRDLLTGEFDLAALSAQDAEPFGPVIKWLSDWHLLVYLDSLGVFEPKDVELMARIASKKETKDMATLVTSSSWQTFMILAQEEGESEKLPPTGASRPYS